LHSEQMTGASTSLSCLTSHVGNGSSEHLLGMADSMSVISLIVTGAIVQTDWRWQVKRSPSTSGCYC